MSNSPVTETGYSAEYLQDGVYSLTTTTRYNAAGQALSSTQKQLISQLSATLESKSVFVSERGLTSMQWSVYNEATKRVQYSAAPTSAITAEMVMVRGFAILQENAEEITSYQANALNQYTMLSVDDITDFIPSYDAAGYIRTNYSYSPYGEVTISGDVTQPIQWSSEYTDTELSLVYYNYRHYNPKQGQWLGRGIVQNNNEYAIANNNSIRIHDYLGAIGVRDCLQKGIELASKAYCRAQQLSNIAKLKGIIWLYSGSEPVCSTSGGCEKITIIVEVGNPCDIFPYNKVGHTGIGIGDNYYDLGPDRSGEWIKFYKNENIEPWWRSNPDHAPFDAESLDNILNDIEKHSVNPTIAITFCACSKNAAKLGNIGKRNIKIWQMESKKSILL